MTPDETSSGTEEGKRWLDGLAGRGGASAEARDGERLRDALDLGSKERSASDAPPWEAVAHAASVVSAAEAMPREQAANDRSFKKRAFAVAACLVLGLGIALMLKQREPADGGLRGGSRQTMTVWRIADPLQAARTLGQRLEAAGARVSIVPSEAGVLLNIQSPRDARDRVNDLLAPLETGVEADGRLSIKVLPLN